DANRYFAAAEPWAKRKSDPKRMQTTLYVAAEVVRQLAILAAPVMPASGGRLLDSLAQEAVQRSFAALGAAHRLAPGLKLPAPVGIFPRYTEPGSENSTKASQKPNRGCSSTTTVTLTFPTLPPSSRPCSG